jgi:hypothetical protein
MEAPTGLCATCRYCEPELMRYTAAPWGVSYACAIRAEPKAPHAYYCLKYEREPGAD